MKLRPKTDLVHNYIRNIIDRLRNVPSAAKNALLCDHRIN